MPGLLNRRGVILITTLWILLILSVIALTFSIELQLEARIARTQIDVHEAYYIARGGIYRAVVELKNDGILDHRVRTAPYDSLGDCWNITDDTRENFVDVPLGDGTYTVSVVDEMSKLNLNKATIRQLEGLFRALEFSDDDAKTFAVSIVDYRDDDTIYSIDSSRTEEEFYFNNTDTTGTVVNLKNDLFSSPEELLRIPGITPKVLFTKRSIYGYPDQKYSIADLLTVEGDGKINVNTAPLPVLVAILLTFEPKGDIDQITTIATKLEEHRNGGDGENGTTDDKPYVNAGEIGPDLGALAGYVVGVEGTIYNYITVSSQLYRITSTGKKGRAKSTVQALVKREWVITNLTEEEKADFELENKGVKEGIQIHLLRWSEQ